MNYYTKNKINNQHLNTSKNKKRANDLEPTNSKEGRDLREFATSKEAEDLRELATSKEAEDLRELATSKEGRDLRNRATSPEGRDLRNRATSPEGRDLRNRATSPEATRAIGGVTTKEEIKSLQKAAQNFRKSAITAIAISAALAGISLPPVSATYSSLSEAEALLEKNSIELPKQWGAIPQGNFTKNVGLSSKFDRARQSLEEHDPDIRKYTKLIDSLYRNSSRRDPTDERNIDQKKNDIDNNFPVLMKIEEDHLHEKKKARFVKIGEVYKFYKNIVNGSKAYAIKILKMAEVARAINKKKLQAYEQGGKISSNAFQVTLTIPIKAMNHFYHECEANICTLAQRELFNSNPKSAVSTYILKKYILKNQMSKTGRLYKYIKNRFNGIKLYFSVVDCNRNGEAHLHMYFIVDKIYEVTKEEYENGETFFNSAETEELANKANDKIFYDKELGIQIASIHIQPTVNAKHFEYAWRKATLSKEQALDDLNDFYRNDVASGDPQIRPMEDKYTKAVYAHAVCRAYNIHRVRRSRNIVDKLGADKEKVLADIEKKYPKKQARNKFYKANEKLEKYFNDTNNINVYYLSQKEAKQFEKHRSRDP